jgi:bacterioferritin (cytochrome b1)
MNSTDGWRCEDFFCGEGRPLLDDGEARVAPLECSSDWVPVLPQLDEVGLCQRDLDRVIEYWRSVTQLEHSSVASFARFTLQMMSVGAPAELLAEIQRAAADEVKHAQSAAEILSALSGAPLSPGALSIVDMSLETSRVALIESLILEACVGETLGVAEITEALKRCDQELVRAHLQRVLEDETRHAGLAWSSLRWLIESAPRDEQAHLVCVTQETFRRAANHLGLTAHAVQLRVTPNVALNSWGVLSSSQTQTIRIRAYRAVVLPCLRELERRFIAA